MSTVSDVIPIAIETKAAWGDAWTPQPEAEFARCAHHAAAADLDALSFSYRYGSILLPGASDFATRAAAGDLSGYWVRAVLQSDPAVELFCGRIAAQSRTLHHGAAHGPSGVQTFTAYGPAWILRRTPVSRSWWWDGDAESDPYAIDWTPALNDPDDELFRSAEVHPDAGVYLWGGEDRDGWTHLEHLRYLLRMFADDAAGPTWSVTGLTAPLAAAVDRLALGPEASLADWISAIAAPTRGLDWTIEPTAGGFAIRVFALQDQEYTWEGGSLPANPDTVTLAAGQSLEQISTEIALSAEHAYKKIRLLGERAIAHVTAWGQIARAADDTLHVHAYSLRARWDVTDEIAYRAGLSDSSLSAAQHDAYRQDSPQFRRVFQCFHITATDGGPFDWFPDETCQSLPRVTDAGELALSEIGLAQASQLEVLATTRLKPNADDPEFLPPLLWIGSAFTGRGDEPHVYAPVDAIGGTVSIDPADGLIFVRCNPPHLIAGEGWFTGDGNASLAVPLYDHHEMVATVAIRTDQRLRLEYALPGWTESDGVLEILVPDAQLWYIAPRTALRLDAAGHLVETAANTLTIIRSDTARLHQVMAETIARYAASRCRVVTQAAGAQDWGGYVGQILVALDDGGPTERLAAPITSVHWEREAGGYKTTLCAGYPR